MGCCLSRNPINKKKSRNILRTIEFENISDESDEVELPNKPWKSEDHFIYVLSGSLNRHNIFLYD
jgi:hypothetical protein